MSFKFYVRNVDFVSFLVRLNPSENYMTNLCWRHASVSRSCTARSLVALDSTWTWTWPTRTYEFACKINCVNKFQNSLSICPPFITRLRFCTFCTRQHSSNYLTPKYFEWKNIEFAYDAFYITGIFTHSLTQWLSRSALTSVERAHGKCTGVAQHMRRVAPVHGQLLHNLQWDHYAWGHDASHKGLNLNLHRLPREYWICKCTKLPALHCFLCLTTF